MKKSLLSLLGFLFLSIGFSFALPAKFEITISPSFKVNEYVDLTIKAIGANGQVDTTYKGQDISIDIEDDQGKAVATADMVRPSNGYGYFEAADLGVKIYSKGLALKKAGTYKVVVADIFNTTIKGSTGFVVVGDGGTVNMGTITVTSPIANSTEQSTAITIIGKTTNGNTPLNIMIDSKKIKDSISDAQGGFSVAVSGLQPGDHSLTVNGLDLANTVIATSGPIPFKIAVQDTTELTATLEIQPSKTVKVNTLVKFIITTNATATAATIALGNASPQPTTKISAGKFEKEMQMTSVGSFPLTVEVVGTSSKKFPNIDTLVVSDEMRKILSLNGSLEPDGTKANLNRTYTGTIEFFKVQYGTDKADMKLSLTTTKPQGQIFLVDPKLTYYAQVSPIDQLGSINGEASQIIEIQPKISAVCGNAVIEAGEECDDGNSSDGDSCSAFCRVTYNAPSTSCGNGVVDVGETCDDGNSLLGDGCYQCKRETCNPPAGIVLRTKKVTGKYYLYRGSVPGAAKYQIFRKDSKPSTTRAINELSLVGETTETMFEYPFDPEATSDQYAWYAVQAVCVDGDTKILDSIKKVKVGPRETLLVMLLVMSVLMYGFMRNSS